MKKSNVRIGLLCLLLTPFTALAAKPPNIVILLADDAGWGDYSWNGNRQVATPQIDSLAQAGAHFERFYVQPVCAPTRSEFLTGRYHRRLGVTGVSTGQERMNLDEKTFAEALQAAGYVTGIFGKWHNGSQWPYHPRARGFDTFYGYTSGHWGEYFDATLERNGVLEPSQGYIVDVCTDQALQFIEKNRAKPFLCYVPFSTPHSPWSVPAADWARFKTKALPQTATNASREQLAETRAALAMVENQDRNVGRILTQLKTLNLEADTLVVYFSDNGPNSARWNGAMKGIKGSTDEGGVRSPLFIRWPGRITAGTTVAPIAGAIDLAPTLLALAGVGRLGDKPLDGRSLAPLLLGGAEVRWADRRLFQTWGNSVSVRTQTHRLDAQGNLYEMGTDPGQTKPLQAQQPELARTLTDAVTAWRREMELAAATNGQGPGGKVTAGGVDPRPLGVGYREFPVTMLPARDGTPRGDMRRSAKAPNSSYFVNWKQLTDSAVWHLEVVTSGTYAVTLDYTCRAADVGATLELAFNQSKLRAKVAEAWDPPLKDGEDVVSRSEHGESLMKEFKTLALGEMRLVAGKGDLILKAVEIPGQGVIDVRRITLTLK